MSVIEPHSDKLKYIFDNAKVGIAICNAEDNTLEMVNPAFAAIHGYEVHELIGASPGEVFAPECMLKLSEYESAPSACSMGDVSFETTHIRKDGSLVPVSVHITVIKDENGIVKQRIANIIDISERRKAESELQITHERFNQIYHNSPDVIYLIEVTPEGRFIHLDINPAYVEASGIPREKIVGRYVDEIEHEAFRNILLDKYSSCLKAGKKTDYINDYPLPSGIQTFHSILTPLFDESGRIHQIVGIARDITEQKRMGSALEARELEFRNLAENSPNIIMRYDLECRRIYVNQAYAHHTGIPADEAIYTTPSEKWNMRMLSMSAEEYQAKIKQVIESGEQTKFVADWYRLSDGGFVALDIHIVAQRDASGKIIGALAIGHDVTERKQMESILASREREFRSLAENTPDNIARWDTEGRYLYINPVHERTLGKSASEIIGTFISNNHISVKNAMTQVAATGEAITVSQTVTAKDGGIEYHEVSIVPERDESGKIVSILGIGRNITERKNMESELEAREQEYRTLTTNSPDHIIRLDTQGRYLYLNPIHERTLGMLASEVIGKPKEELFPEHTAVLDAVDRIIKTGEEEITVLQPVPGENGEMEIHEVKLIAEKNAEGEIVSILGIGRDITERNQAEEALKIKEQEFRNLAENSPDTITRFDIECRRIYVNPSFERTFGWQSADVLGKTPTELSPLPDNIFFEKQLRHVLQTGKEVSLDMSFVDANGAQGFGNGRIVPEYDSEGNIIGLLAIGRDITERRLMEKQLLEQNRFLESLLNAIPVPIFLKDKETRYQGFNKAFEEFYGKNKEELIGKGVFDIFPTEQAQVFFDADAELFRNGGIQIYETQLRDARGVDHTVMFHKAIYCDEAGEAIGQIGTILDITERKAMEEKILQSEKRLKEAQKIAKIGSWELNFTAVALIWSDEIYQIFEVQKTIQPSYELFLNTVHPDDRDMVNAAYEDSLNNQTSYDIVHRMLMSDGRIKYIHERGETTYDEEGNPLHTIGTAQDITQQKSVEKKIQHMAHHDALTGLPNRILAKERAERIMAHAKNSDSKAAFLFIDLDGFKAINDTLGHSIGDAMLKSVASRLKECIRESDTISRQGGDEFLLILSDIYENDSTVSVAKNILAELEKPFEINTHALSVSGSIGIALYPDHGETFEALLQSSDTAMYKAKETGKNSYHFYTQQMTHHMIGQFKIQNDLKNALNNNEFILHYQPQIDLSTNRIIGVEALIRWYHPQLGMIPPMSFISIAENSGMIVSIGQWVIEEACRQAALWEKMEIKLSVAVNISAMQFKRGNLEEIVKNALFASQIDPHRLELELTESIIMHDADNTLQSVRNLKALGVQLSIDDFGTGYSSLSYLKRFAVDKLKIDQSFVRDILKDKDDASIVKTIIQMAKNLNLTTIAEGVENQEVLSIIQEFGCDEVQGYHFAKPMNASDFERYHTNFYGKES